MSGRRFLQVVGLAVLMGCSAYRCGANDDATASRASWAIPKASVVANWAQVPATDASTKSALKQGTEELTWTFDQTAYGRIDVVVVLPDRSPQERFPLLIALHGRGEAMKGPVRGARGWVDDYALGRAIRRLTQPPLMREDFEGFVDDKRMSLLNTQLKSQPYGGLVVLCPYTPDVLAGERPFERVREFSRFLVETLIPRARRELPVIASPQAVGIDGVSLGGRVALLAGLYQPSAFGVVASLQAAFDSSDAERLAVMGIAASRTNSKLRFRFLTSTGDFFLAANRAIDAAYTHRHVDHEFVVVPGPHDYIFNRGPGAVEMLLYHDRALRAVPLH